MSLTIPDNSSFLNKIEKKGKNIKIIKKIGVGYMGDIYNCTIDNKPAICKIEKNDDHNRGSASAFVRQIEFDTFCRKYPNNFLILEDYGVIQSCDYNYDTVNDTDEGRRKNRERLNEKKDCVYLIYTPILDGTLNDIRESLPDKDRTVMIKSVSKVINIMNKNGYYHRDMHCGNIMYKKVDNNYEWYIIDYGCIYNYKYIYIPDDKGLDDREFFANDITCLIMRCLLDIPIYGVLGENKMNIPMLEESIKTIKKSKYYPTIKKIIPKNIPYKFINEAICIIVIIIYSDLHILSTVGTDNYEKFKQYGKKQKDPELLLSLLNLVKDATHD